MISLLIFLLFTPIHKSLSSFYNASFLLEPLSSRLRRRILELAIQRKKKVKVPKKLRKLLKKQRKEAKKLKDEQVFYCKITICQSDEIKAGKGKRYSARYSAGKGKRYSATIKFSQSAG
jgi:hypothetical protein